MYDLVILVANQNQGTILDRIANEIRLSMSEQDVHIMYHPYERGIQHCSTILVTHYSLVLYVPVEDLHKTIVFFTHESMKLPEFTFRFNSCRKVICENQVGYDLLLSYGVNEDKLAIIVECGDNEVFKPHERKPDGQILICSRNYKDGRKNPEVLHEVIDLLPHRSFIVLGRDWQFPQSNVEMCNPLYIDYPSYYEKCSIYLSAARLEGGGPNSLIESMHANLLPVVSDTGNSRDYITHGYNGLIFPIDSQAEHIASLIERAYTMNPKKVFPFNDVWKTVTDYNWKNYGAQWTEYLLVNQTSQA